MLADTVGFIHRLPHMLVEAFKATLEEVRTADLLLHVVDASSPLAAERMEVVDRVLEEIGAGAAPRIVVMNKVDLVPADARCGLLRIRHGRDLSAAEPAAWIELLGAMARWFSTWREEVSVSLPVGRGDLVAMARRDGEVLSEEYSDGIGIAARAGQRAGSWTLAQSGDCLNRASGRQWARTCQLAPSPRLGGLLPSVDRVHLGHLLKLPNIITLCRIGLVPIFLVLLSKERFTAALYVFVLAAVTDALDGTVARWFDMPHRARRVSRSVCRQAAAAECAVVLTFGSASGLAFDRDRNPRHGTGVRLHDDFVRRGRALPRQSEHLRQNDHGTSHRLRDWHADSAFRHEPARLVCAAVPDRVSPGGVGDSLPLPGAGLPQRARPRAVFVSY